jgi:D-tyrosyl-tRNA(Tyr) deacylase
MKLVIQRVREAAVRIDGEEVARIGPGALVLVGVAEGDTQDDALFLAAKTAKLRIYDDERGQMNRAIDAVDGAFLAVSQFTLYADCRKGNRPSYIQAAQPEAAQQLYERYVEALRASGHHVQTGRFRENMQVSLVNDGPVTIIMESCGRG